MKQKKLEILEIKNGDLINRIKPCPVCGEVPSITLKRWKDPEIKGKMVKFSITCETNNCPNGIKSQTSGEMTERDFLKDILSILELKISGWNSMVEKQREWIDAHISTVEKIISSDAESINANYVPIVKYIKFHDTEGKYSGKYDYMMD